MESSFVDVCGCSREDDIIIIIIIIQFDIVEFFYGVLPYMFLCVALSSCHAVDLRSSDISEDLFRKKQMTFLFHTAYLVTAHLLLQRFQPDVPERVQNKLGVVMQPIQLSAHCSQAPRYTPDRLLHTSVRHLSTAASSIRYRAAILGVFGVVLRRLLCGRAVGVALELFTRQLDRSGSWQVQLQTSAEDALIYTVLKHLAYQAQRCFRTIRSTN